MYVLSEVLFHVLRFSMKDIQTFGYYEMFNMIFKGQHQCNSIDF